MGQVSKMRGITVDIFVTSAEKLNFNCHASLNIFPIVRCSVTAIKKLDMNLAVKAEKSKKVE